MISRLRLCTGACAGPTPGRAPARGCCAHGHDGRGPSRGCDAAELLGAMFPGRLGDRRAEDLGPRPHRRSRAGRTRAPDRRARPRLSERRPRPRADDTNVRGCRRANSSRVGGGIVWDSTPRRRWRSRGSRPARSSPPSALPRRRPSRHDAAGGSGGGHGIVDPDQPVLHADDEALLRGRAAFETMRALRRHRSASTSICAPRRLRGTHRPPRRRRARVRRARPHRTRGSAGTDAVLRVYWTAGREGEAAPGDRARQRDPVPSRGMRERGISVITLPSSPTQTSARSRPGCSAASSRRATR